MITAEFFRQVAPYVAWMLLMSALPQSADAYALRSVVTFLLLLFSWRRFRLPSLRALAWGTLAGVVVFVVWIVPDSLFGVAVSNSRYNPKVCGSALTLFRIVGSALVIPVAEELFFRRWLLDFAGFGWMVALFAVEHLRLDHGAFMGLAYVAEGAFAGYVYGRIAQRCGLKAAIVAHIATNLLLAIMVVGFGKWQFW